MLLGRALRTTTPIRTLRSTTNTPFIINAAIISQRSSFQQPTAAMSTMGSTISDVVMRDHRELNEAYQQILDAPDDDGRVRWQNQFTWELARHSIGEELVVYPAMEKHLGAEGKVMADKDRGEHQPVRDFLSDSTSCSTITRSMN